jgi:hypothetical protein
MLLQVYPSALKNIVNRLKVNGSDSFREILWFSKQENGGIFLLFHDIINNLNIGTFLTPEDVDSDYQQILNNSFELINILDIYNLNYVLNAIMSLKPKSSDFPPLLNEQQKQEQLQNQSSVD